MPNQDTDRDNRKTIAEFREAVNMTARELPRG
jgi:hypothetical protein